MSNETKIRLYHVKCWEAAKEPNRWGRHLVFGVVCLSASQALAHVASEHPEVRIDAVNDGGIVHYTLV